jgi:hypothetical protein
MYLDSAFIEDKKMVESWKGDADGMLVFVRHQITSLDSVYDVGIVDWSILCCGRGIACSVYPEYSAELARHCSFLSRKSLTIFHPGELVPVQPQPAVYSAYVGRLG